MKVFLKDRVCVQNKDLIHLLRFCDSLKEGIPSSIIDKVFGKVYIVTSDNENDFVDFYKDSEIDFFRKLDWIVDYREYSDLSEEDLINAGCGIVNECASIATGFNELPEEDRARLYSDVNHQLELLEYKMLGVRDILWHKQGELKFAIPCDNAIIKKSKPRGRTIRRLIDKFL